MRHHWRKELHQCQKTGFQNGALGVIGRRETGQFIGEIVNPRNRTVKAQSLKVLRHLVDAAMHGPV